MKRFAAIMLSLALALAVSTASAHSWGAKGKLVQELSAVKTWDDYTGVTEQAGEWMVLGGRYHNVLMFAGEDGLHLYHTAVWQPEDHRTMRLSLRNGELTLTAGAESFTFGECNDEMVLIRAELGGVTVRGNFSESEPPYEITLIYDDGTVNVKGLILEEDGFGLINNEGGGGYVRKELELTEDADHG